MFAFLRQVRRARRKTARRRPDVSDGSERAAKTRDVSLCKANVSTHSLPFVPPLALSHRFHLPCRIPAPLAPCHSSLSDSETWAAHLFVRLFPVGALFAFLLREPLTDALLRVVPRFSEVSEFDASEVRAVPACGKTRWTHSCRTWNSGRPRRLHSNMVEHDRGWHQRFTTWGGGVEVLDIVVRDAMMQYGVDGAVEVEVDVGNRTCCRVVKAVVGSNWCARGRWREENQSLDEGTPFCSAGSRLQAQTFDLPCYLRRVIESCT